MADKKSEAIRPLSDVLKRAYKDFGEALYQWLQDNPEDIKGVEELRNLLQERPEIAEGNEDLHQWLQEHSEGLEDTESPLLKVKKEKAKGDFDTKQNTKDNTDVKDENDQK